MIKEEIHYDSDDENVYCPVTDQLILDEGGPSLSDACLLYYWESESDMEFKSGHLKSKYDEYLSVLNTDTSSSPSDWDKEAMAMKLLLNELEKGNKNLELYTILFTVSTATNEYVALNFCIDMNYNLIK